MCSSDLYLVFSGDARIGQVGLFDADAIFRRRFELSTAADGVNGLYEFQLCAVKWSKRTNAGGVGRGVEYVALGLWNQSTLTVDAQAGQKARGLRLAQLGIGGGDLPACGRNVHIVLECVRDDLLQCVGGRGFLCQESGSKSAR